MADLGGHFDAEQVEPMKERNFDPIPKGEYTAQIVSSETVQTKAGDGSYLKLEWMLTDEGPFQNRRIWSQLNIQNPKQITMDIAWKELGSICRAVGKLKVSDSAELHDIPCVIKVHVKAPKGDFPARSEIVGYRAVGSDAVVAPPASPRPAASRPASTPAPYRPPAAAAAPQSRQPVGAGTGAAPPWQRK